MGLKNSGSHFQRVLSTEVLQGLVSVMCINYLYDILIFGDRETLPGRMREVFARFRPKNIVLKRRQCSFGLKEIKYLGHTISGSGMRMSDERKKVLNDIQLPQSGTQLRAFLRLANYFRRFLPGYAQIAAPLYRMTVGPKRIRRLWLCRGRKSSESRGSTGVRIERVKAGKAAVAVQGAACGNRLLRNRG